MASLEYRHPCCFRLANRFFFFFFSLILTIIRHTNNNSILVNGFAVRRSFYSSPSNVLVNNHRLPQQQRQRFSSSSSVSSVRLFLSSNDGRGNQEVKHQQHIVIVGGGVGGLASAARIASSKNDSCRITILEKNVEGGGRCGSFDVTIPKYGTFRHERGPSLLLLPNVYRNLFRDCTGQASENFGLSMAQCIPAYQVVFEDGDCIEIGFPEQQQVQSDSSLLVEAKIKSREKMDSYEDNGANKWDEYMQAMSAYLDCGLPNFIEERLDLISFPAFLYEALRENAKSWPLKPHSDVLDAIFESNKMKALASFQDLYVGLEPYRNDNKGILTSFGGGVLRSTAPAVFGLLAAIELHPTNKKSGVFAPIGGFRAVTNAMESLVKRLGVTIQYGMTVTSVDGNGVRVCSTSENHDDDGMKGGDFIPADLVIVNADLPYATKSLLSSNDKSIPSDRNNELLSDDGTNRQKLVPKFDWDDSFDYSSGVISFHWSIDKVLEDLNTHNVFMVARSRSQAEASWLVLRSGDNDDDEEKMMDGNNDMDSPFNFYVHRASKTDPTAAPDGCDGIMVLVPCKTLLRDEACAKLPRQRAMERYKQQFSDEVVSRTREAVLKRLAAIKSLHDLRAHILDEVVDTPATYADQYNLAAGTPFALVRLCCTQAQLTR